MQDKHKLWCEKYRPQVIEDYIFHDAHQRSSFEAMIANKSIPHLLLSGVQGSGKAQPLSAKILTPTGWTSMGTILPGDEVYSSDGMASKVLEVFPQGEKDIFRLTFHDGATTECCLDHLWECYFPINYTDRKATKHVVDTRFLIRYMQERGNHFNVSIPLAAAINFTNVSTIPIDPYILGVLLGDGSLCSPTPKLTTADQHIVDMVQERLLNGYQVKPVTNTVIEYHIVNNERINYGGRIGVEENFYTKYFRDTGLYKKRSWEKFLPSTVKTSTTAVRLAVLQGLFDTDGTVGKKGDASLTTTSYQLAHDVQEVLWSLGCVCTLSVRHPTYSYKKEKRQGREAYELHFNHPEGTKQFFTLPRKVDRASLKYAMNHISNITLRRRIHSIEYVGRKEAQCILIDHPSHLYITDDYVVTHNTTLAQILIRSMELDPSDVLVINASRENTVDVVREKISSFVSTFAMSEFKIVHMEECDYLTLNGQAVMRDIMEKYADHVRFILTCNYVNRIMPALISRCQHFHFKSPDKTEVVDYCFGIMAFERVKFTDTTLVKYITYGYPDIRKIVNSLQQNTIDGELVEPKLEGTSGDWKFQLIDQIEQDKWNDARKLVCTSVDGEEWIELYRFLYENLRRGIKFKDTAKWEEGILTIAKHLYQHSICADSEINAAAMFISLGQL